MTTPRLTCGFPAFLACFLLAAHVTADEPKPNPAADKAAFEKAAAGAAWAEVFSDSCTADWKEKWFLDGEVGTVTNSPEGMTLTAGPEFRNDAHHMVLWTKDSFEGDLKIDGAPDDMPGLRYRAAFCRCGDSANKPYCDNTHEKNAFRDRGALGTTGDSVEESGGPLEIQRAPDGPLIVSGNFSMVTGAGRKGWCGKKAALCRCGASKNKPFCDGSHKPAGFKAD